MRQEDGRDKTDRIEGQRKSERRQCDQMRNGCVRVVSMVIGESAGDMKERPGRDAEGSAKDNER